MASTNVITREIWNRKLEIRKPTLLPEATELDAAASNGMPTRQGGTAPNSKAAKRK
jgi:hypothetical protein